MPIRIPHLDDRDWRELRDEALRRIPIHNPEWTNFNTSDPGVTIIEVFAFLTENLLYLLQTLLGVAVTNLPSDDRFGSDKDSLW